MFPVLPPDTVVHAAWSQPACLPAFVRSSEVKTNESPGEKKSRSDFSFGATSLTLNERSI